MKQKNALRSGLQVAAILVVLFMLTGYLLITLAAARTSIYYPLINRLDPVGEELNLRLLISEVMNNPCGHEPGLEWIEIYNRSIQRINLVGHKIGDSETRGDPEGMYHFPVGSIIGPGQVVVIANQGLCLAKFVDFNLIVSSWIVIKQSRIWLSMGHNYQGIQLSTNIPIPAPPLFTLERIKNE